MTINPDRKKEGPSPDDSHIAPPELSREIRMKDIVGEDVINDAQIHLSQHSISNPLEGTVFGIELRREYVELGDRLVEQSGQVVALISETNLDRPFTQEGREMLGSFRSMIERYKEITRQIEVAAVVAELCVEGLQKERGKTEATQGEKLEKSELIARLQSNAEVLCRMWGYGIDFRCMAERLLNLIQPHL